ncbi:DUF1737 domain-containing protein [Escherichia coli]|nr:DUF1737 domain-containing protein [Escherichia coli]
MVFKHYDVVRAASPSDLAERLTQKLKEGWQPFGSPVAITPYTLMQAIAAEGDVSTPVVVTGDDGKAVVNSTTSEPEYYFVVVLAGQSNGMAYGEGLPLPETYDRPDSRIKQLARRSTVTPGGDTCAYNDVIQADHCLHDVQDMSALNHPHADLSKGQYGTVGQGLHIAKKLLPFIPADAGILLVPCCRGGSAFTVGTAGTFSESTGASEDSLHWSVDKPLYQDLLSRTRAALAKNPKNKLLAVVWMQGEADLASGSQQHNGLFTAMVQQFRADLSPLAAQCVSGNATTVPWICGDTTYYWKEKYAAQYEAVYGGYKGKEAQNIHFVPLMTDEHGDNVPTNEPSEDPDIITAGYYGAASRSDGNWTTADRKTHFSSWARRGIISDRLSTAILTHAGRTAAFLLGVEDTGSISGVQEPSSSGGEAEQPGTTAEPVSATTLLSYRAAESGGALKAQGWTAGGGSASIVDDSDATGGKAMQVSPKSNMQWNIDHTAGNGEALLAKGGRIFIRFKVPGGLVADQIAFGIYWQVSALPSGVTLPGEGNAMLAAFYVSTDSADLNLMQYNSGGNKLGTFGAFDNDWHTLEFEFAGNNSIQVTPVLDEVRGTPFSLEKSPGSSAVDTLRLTNQTANQTYTLLVDRMGVEVNNAVPAASS